MNFNVLEAIIARAAEHPRGCSCVVCLAASGDVDAMAEIMAEVVWAPQSSTKLDVGPRRT
jgi:hypothetical protein